MPFFQNHYWIIDGSAFQWPDDWDDQSEFDPNKQRYVSGPLKTADDLISSIQEFPNTFYALPDIFPEYAKYLMCFDCAFFGFKRNMKHPESWLKEYYNLTDRKKFVCSTTNFLFYDIDGAFWELFSQQKIAIETIQSQKKSMNILI